MRIDPILERVEYMPNCPSLYVLSTVLDLHLTISWLRRSDTRHSERNYHRVFDRVASQLVFRLSNLQRDFEPVVCPTRTRTRMMMTTTCHQLDERGLRPYTTTILSSLKRAIIHRGTMEPDVEQKQVNFRTTTKDQEEEAIQGRADTLL